MASGKENRVSSGKKSPSKKAPGGKSNSGQKQAGRQEQTVHENFTGEILLWIVLAASILLFISNFGIGGKVGNSVSGFFFGVFGLVAYIFPIVLVVGTFFFISNRGNRIAAVKIAAACIFVLFFCMFLELIVRGKDAPGAMEVFQECFETKVGGGLLGGFLAKLCCPNFGLIGAYVIDIIVMIICIVLVTERSALRGVQKGGRKVYETAKENSERRREISETRREERALRRMDKKVEGVALDTTIPEKKKTGISDEVSEIHIEQFQDVPEVKEEHHVTLTSVQSEEPKKPAAAAPDIPSINMMPREIERAAERVDRIHGISGRKETVLDEALPELDLDIIRETKLEEMPEFERMAEEAPVLSEASAVSAAPEQMPLKAASETKLLEKSVEPETEPVQANSFRPYIYPSPDLLKKAANKRGDSRQQIQETAVKLQQTLKNFGVNVTITNVSKGPAVTRYEIQPEQGVKVSKIVNLTDDIKLNLAAADIRIEAPIPGKAAVGIEVPNKENVVVSFRELVESQEFESQTSNIAFGVGRDISGKVMIADIAKMPHLLIAGATGSGKSVCINTIIMSILYKADPKDVKLIMVDPKVVELSVYNGIPHLMIPVVTDPKKAAGALHWAVAEMMDRYQKFAETGVRDLKGYNAKIQELDEIEGEDKPQKLPQIVIIVDELADLMMVAAGDVEEAICRLAQLARACGIHLIIATQRPSVNVITGLIKANMPSRIAFAVTSGIDSRTILDMNGAEKLLGKGDMLFHPQGAPKPIRVQGAFVSDKEVSDVVKFLKEQNGSVSYSEEIEEKVNSMDTGSGAVAIDGKGDSTDGRDSYFTEAAKLLIDKEKGSIGMLQRYFKIGFNRAARIMDQLEEAGIVGPEEGTKPRRILMTAEEFEQYEKE